MNGTIQNRDAFLANIAGKLGRKPMASGVKRPDYKHKPQYEVLPQASKEELLEVLRQQSLNVHVDFFETDVKALPGKLNEVVELYGGGPVSLWDDQRFETFGLTPLIQEGWPKMGMDVHVWDPAIGEKNIKLCEKANVGITFSDITLAESGTVVLFSSKERGRSVSLLPKTYIAIVPKSTIVPRMTQAAIQIREKIKNGETVPSCINFITGPSNSADIEMNLIVGVHGPVKAAYLVVNDR
ncbi:lactate utilization protein C [Weizmannia acidilactici]|uniref:Lactate utilization protein C n=1 Tax=Weizmannia acidilactici TaxID=2607726 RepID=A0A5J4JN57_9BACI|nr:lactate utilization protein C [Weizmannia acidilactici]GER66682.1 lactate utilization protein C [Weizmannia acidilactici]GER71817.1 lactate utilization protein C [Weizmannia acidilactici]GER72837.1 lactate utilization protein C [Weizmannia acidilactici]